MDTQQLSHVLFFLMAFCVYTPPRDRLPQPVSLFSDQDYRPVIGIAAIKVRRVPPPADTYVPASYVRFLQHAGARVVPIRAGEPYEYYVDLFSKLNGAILPGGWCGLGKTVYFRTASILFNLTLEAFDRSGEIFPLWGTCLGFELFLIFTAGREVIDDTDAVNILLPLNLTAEHRHSRMLSQAPPDVLTYLTTENITAHGHRFGVLVDVFNNNTALRNFYRVLSTNVDKKGKEFVSTIEAYRYPIYGTQWHPEKNRFNWNPNYVINHSQHAVRAAQHFADFFVGEASKSTHRFPPEEAETAVLPDGFTTNFYHLNFTESAIRNMKALKQVG